MSNCSIWGLLASWGGYLGVTCCLSCARGLLASGAELEEGDGGHERGARKERRGGGYLPALSTYLHLLCLSSHQALLSSLQHSHQLCHSVRYKVIIK